MENQEKLRQQFKNLRFNDWRILNCFYKENDWKSNSFCIKEIMEKKQMSRIQTRHILTKLWKLGLINKFNSFINFYTPIKDNETRRVIKSEYKKLMFSLMGVEDY